MISEKKTVKIILVLVMLGLFFNVWFLNRSKEVSTERILDLANLWSTASNSYGYWEYVDSNLWNQAFTDAVEQLEDVSSDYEYYLLLEEFLATLQDGHGVVLSANGNNLFRYLPIKLDYIEGKYVVVKKNNLGKVPLYSEIIMVENLDFKNYLQQNVAKYVGLQTPLAREKALADRFCKGKQGDKIEVTFKTMDGEIIKDSLTYGNVPNDWLKKTSYLKESGKNIFASENLKIHQIDNILQVEILSVKNEEVVREFTEQVLFGSIQYAGIVLDFRNCSGGNGTHTLELLQMFANQPIPSTGKSSIQVKNARDILYYNLHKNLPKGYSLDSTMALDFNQKSIKRGELMTQNKFYMEERDWLHLFDETIQFNEFYAESTHSGALKDVPHIILISSDTVSAAEAPISSVQSVGETVIGTPSNGKVGTIYQLKLNNQWRVTFSSQHTYGANGQELWNKGVQPNVYCALKLSDVVNGVDTQLTEAIAYLKEHGAR